MRLILLLLHVWGSWHISVSLNGKSDEQMCSISVLWSASFWPRVCFCQSLAHSPQPLGTLASQKTREKASTWKETWSISPVKRATYPVLPSAPNAQPEAGRMYVEENATVSPNDTKGFVSTIMQRLPLANETLPACLVKPCVLPEETANGYYQLIKGDEFVFGSIIKYFCNDG